MVVKPRCCLLPCTMEHRNCEGQNTRSMKLNVGPMRGLFYNGAELIPLRLS